MNDNQGHSVWGAHRAAALGFERLLLRFLTVLGPTWLMLACTTIPPGRSAVSQIAFDGVDQIDEDDLQERLATTETPKFLSLFRGLVFEYRVFNIHVLKRDLQRVERYYRARGFYKAKVRAGRVTYYDEDDLVRVELVVTEGPPTSIDRVWINGLEQLDDEIEVNVYEAAAAAGASQGQRFDEQHFQAAENAILRVLTSAGYAHAEIKRIAQVDVPRDLAYVRYDVVPHMPAVYGPIEFVGLEGLPEAELRKALDLYPGEPFSSIKIDQGERALLQSGLFSTVRIEPNLTSPEARVVPIRVVCRVAKHKSVRLGIGAQADARQTNLHLIIGWEHRNFLGGLRRLRIDFKPGVVLYPTRVPGFAAPEHFLPQQRLSLDIMQPGWLEARTNVFHRAQYSVFPLILSDRVIPDAPVLGYHELKAALGVDRVFGRLYGLLAHNVQYNVPFAYVGTADPALDPVLISYPNLLVRFDITDDSVNPTRGITLQNDLQVAGVGGDARDVRVEPEVKFYVPLGRKLTLALRGTLGLLFPQNYGDIVRRSSLGDFPSDAERAAWFHDSQVSYLRAFFSGGPTSNRGYAFNAVGPHGVVPFYIPQSAVQACTVDDVTPQCALPLGGFSLWETSVELRYPISGPLGGVTFCDASDVALDELTLHGNPHLSCGLGLRYASPVGPVRLDLGYRIPGLQKLAAPDRNEGEPGDILGLPLAVSIGLGEAF